MKTRDITFNGQTWEQLSPGQRIASIKWCVDHAFDHATLHHKWIGRWLILHGPQIGIASWRKILKEARGKIAQEHMELDAPKHKTSHVSATYPWP